MLLPVLKAGFIDHAADEDEVAAIDDAGQFVQKTFFMRSALEPETAFLLSDVVFVKDNVIVSKLIELEPLQSRNDRFTVMPLIENAEGQDEDRVVGIENLQAMVPTLINIDYKITEMTLS